MKDINDIVNRVMQEQQHDRRRTAIENYINRVAARIQLSTTGDISMIDAYDLGSDEEVQRWKSANKQEFAYKVSEVARIILRQELLGEK